MSGARVILCAFWRDVRICDNLVGDVPACVVAKFYPDVDPCSLPVLELERYCHDFDVVCVHFVRTDFYLPKRKRGCYFGGACVHADVRGFDACCAGCFR
jgi:hypothetical protein